MGMAMGIYHVCKQSWTNLSTTFLTTSSEVQERQWEIWYEIKEHNNILHLTGVSKMSVDKNEELFVT